MPYRLIIFGLFLSATIHSVIAQNTYFQQTVNYQIDVELNDITHELHAYEQLEYINNSTDTLTQLYFHLWPNAYKNNNTALAKQLLNQGSSDFYHAPVSEKGYVDSLDFKIDNKTVQWKLDDKFIDIALLTLNEPLLPGNSITITTPFHVKIPKGIFSRLGHLDQSYQITQWYPKPAVYDKDGWHPMPYLDQGEFYSEFGSFDVKITLPANYVVGATGDLVNGETELKWLDSIVVETKKITNYDVSMEFPPSSNQKKTLHYHQENVHDFGWFADKRYHVLKGSVKLPHSGDSVTTWVMYTNSEADLWVNSLEYMHDAIYNYSLWNGDYPYKHATAVDGALSSGAGMEYPNVTVIGESGSAFVLETVIMHEIGHNWFYGILGSNERLHPWMDEGLNSLNELRYIEKKYPYSSLFNDTVAPVKLFSLSEFSQKDSYLLMYQFNAARNLDQPIELPSEAYSSFNYGGIVYSKTAIVFNYLKAYLGEQLFDRCMQRYFNEWKFKHPSPIDLETIFEEESQQDLDWFFKDCLLTTKKVDYKIKRFKNNELTLINKGELQIPVNVSIIHDDTITQTFWVHNKNKTINIPMEIESYDKIIIDADRVLWEVRQNNNQLKNKGPFKKLEPIKLQYLGGLNRRDKTQLFYTPLVGYNYNDRAMLGMAFHNVGPIQKKMEFIIAPMYGLGSGNPTGFATVNYNILPKESLFQQITLSSSAQTFQTTSLLGITAPYYKINPKVEFKIKSNDYNSPESHLFSLENIAIIEPENIATSAEDYLSKVDKKATSTSYYGLLKYNYNNKHVLYPSSINTALELASQFSKLTFSAETELMYKRFYKGVKLRFFLGAFLHNNSDNGRYNFRMDGSYLGGIGGYYDYKYEELFLDRNGQSDFLSRQLSEQQGGFKVPTIGGQSHQFISTLNIKVPAPLPLPIGLFADIGTNHELEIFYDAGIYVSVLKGYCEVYVPLTYSDNIRSLISDQNSLDLIRFTLHLNKANPIDLLKSVDI